MSGYSYIKPIRHIKDSIWGNSGSDAYPLENYRSVSNKMLNATDLKQFWKDLGVDISMGFARDLVYREYFLNSSKSKYYSFSNIINIIIFSS